MRKIYIIDYIGEHSGVKYYLDSFKRSLQDLNEYEVEILSNYSESNAKRPFFKNHYQGIILRKLFNLIVNILRLYKFVGRNLDDVFIYEAYGTKIDVPFIKIISKAPNHVIDIHEAIAQNEDANKSLLSSFSWLYENFVKTAISHSCRTNNYLINFKYSGKLFNVPHFRYNVDGNFDMNNIASEILCCYDDSKINLLFFGNVNESKGIDILFEALNSLFIDEKNKINLVVAGKDFDGSINRVKLDERIQNVKILRFITDDELKYLYSRCDYVLLPYRKTSQSGIIEMSLNFRKPIIASNIPYFEKTLSEFPSFGILTSGIMPDDFAKGIKLAIAKKENDTVFFNSSDYDKYTNRKEIKDFFINFNEWVKKCNYSVLHPGSPEK